MKQIRLSKIRKMVKDEYEAGRDWCSIDWGHYFKMMIDTDGDIWSDVFISENDWNVYHSDSIVQLNRGWGSVKDTEDGYVDSAVQILRAAGWEVIDYAD